MGRAPCCDKANVKKGPWSPDEDSKLKAYIDKNGTGGNWIALPQKIGLKRCGKSCRLRWLNYLRPNIKHGGFSEQEDNIICSLYLSIGSRWSIIAGQLPGRTDNDIKNYWNTKLKKKLLGKQREHRQALTLHAKSFKDQQEIMTMKKEDHENFTTSTLFQGYINQPPYWPGQVNPLVAMPLANLNQNPCLINNEQESLRNWLLELEGTFSDTSTIDQLYSTTSPNIYNNYDHVNSATASAQTNFDQGIENFASDQLGDHELDYNSYNQENLNNGLEGFYGINNNNNAINGSNASSSIESSNWGAADKMSSYKVYPHDQLVSDNEAGYEQCNMTQDLDYDQDSSYFVSLQ